MPELPEVETVARDLRPRIVGATITGARVLVGADAPDAHARGVRARRSPVDGSRRVGRRAKRVVVELSGDAALTIHLKMTGQLFVVPAERAGGPVRPPRPRAGRRPRAALPRHPQVRADRAVRARPGRPASSSPRSAAAAVFARTRAGAARPGVHAARLPAPAAAADGPAQAAAARPVVPRRRRQHLRRRGAVGGAAPPAADRRRRSGRPTSAACTTAIRRDPGRGDRAARQLDRRLHGARRRRLDAGAPAGLPADRRALPALRPADQADRHRGAVDPLLLVVPAPAARPTARAPPRSCATMTGGPRRAGRRWTELAGEGTRRADRATRPRAAATRARTERTKRAAATRARPRARALGRAPRPAGPA